MLHLPGAAGETGRWCALGGLGEASGSHLGRRRAAAFTFIAPRRLSCEPPTRARVRLLGPCYKTGRVGGRHHRGPRAPFWTWACPRPGRHGAVGNGLRTVRSGRRTRRERGAPSLRAPPERGAGEKARRTLPAAPGSKRRSRGGGAL
uniref:(northern house mosquito) hypothetical protein n=1 Tax=Culex pipiens TaxID=7175 RepID=A0A8D8DFG7_CULPI